MERERNTRNSAIRTARSPGVWMATTFLLLTIVSLAIVAPTGAATLYYGVREAGDLDGTVNLSSWFTMSVATNTALVCYAPGLPGPTDPARHYEVWWSSYRSVVGTRHNVMKLPLANGGYYETSVAWAGTVVTHEDTDFFVTDADGAHPHVFVDESPESNLENTWQTLGIYKFPTNNPELTQIEGTNSQCLDRSGNCFWHSTRLVSQVPTAPTPTYPADLAPSVPITGLGNELTWTPGTYNYSWDVYLSTVQADVDSKAAGALVGNVLVPTFDAETISGGLVAGNTYYWKLVARNAEYTVDGPTLSFTASATLGLNITGIAVTGGVESTAGGSVSGQGFYILGTGTISWTATPNENYYFDGWTQDVAGTLPITMDNPRVWTPSGDETFYGQFNMDTTKPAGSIEVNPPTHTAMSYNVTVALNITDSQSGLDTMCFANEDYWTPGSPGMFSTPEPFAATKAWTLNTNIDEGGGPGTKTVYAKVKDHQGNEETFTATVTLTGNSLVLGLCGGGNPIGAGVYPQGTSVTVQGNPNPGYRVVNWTRDGCAGGDVVSTAANYTFTMPADDPYYLYCNYAANNYTLTRTACTGGTVSGSSGSIATDTPCSVTATPDDPTQYRLKNWTTDGCGGTAVVSTNATYEFLMPPNNYTLYANFEYTPLLTVGVNPVAGGSAVGGGARYAIGESVTVTATVNAGYRLYGWSTDVNGYDIVDYSTDPTDLSYTFPMPATDYTLYAQFVVPDLIWRDSFEDSDVSAYSVAPGPAQGVPVPVPSTVQKRSGNQSLQHDRTAYRMYGALGQNVPSGMPVAMRLWVWDPASTTFGQVAGLADGLAPPFPPSIGFMPHIGIDATGVADVRARCVGAPSSTSWANMPGCPRLYGQWNRYDVWFDGGANAKFYANGVLGKTITDIATTPSVKQVLAVSLGVGAGSSVFPTAPAYYDDLSVFKNPAFLDVGVQSGTGSVSGSLEGIALGAGINGYYYAGENVSLSATPVPGFLFTKWVNESGVQVSTANPYSFVMTSANTTVKAVFDRDPAYSLLTISPSPVCGGNGTFGYYVTGTAVDLATLTSTRAGFQLLGWSTTSDGNNPVANPYTLTADATLYAMFRLRAFTETFDTYAITTSNYGDIDMQGTVNPSANGNLNGNPWFGKATPDNVVIGGINSIYPHSGLKQLASAAGTSETYINNENAVNLAYRLNDGNAFTGNVYMDWWFCNRPLTNPARDHAGLSFYESPMCDTAGQDYNFADGFLHTHLRQFLAIGCADVDYVGTALGTGNPAGSFDVTKYQIRCMGAPGGFSSGTSNFSTGWFNTTVPRSIGWHHFRIEVGPALTDGTNDVSFYIDDMVTPTAVKNTTTTGGVNSLSVYVMNNLTAGVTYSARASYFDEIQFGKLGTQSIEKWNVIGHYANTDQPTRLTTDYFAAGTEAATEANAAASTGKSINGNTWGLVTGPIVDFNRFKLASYAPYSVAPTYTENGASYMFTYIVNGGADITDALMSCGSDDGIKVFLNGTAIYTNDVYRGFRADQDYYGPFTIPAGISRLLVKVTNGVAGYAGQVRLTHADGSPLTGVSYVASDDVAPTGGSVQINGGAASTISPNVTLSLVAATDAMNVVNRVQLSEDGVTYGAPVAFAASLPFTLTGADGEKTVYVKFLDAAGNESAAVSDTITLSSTPPCDPPAVFTPLSKISDIWAVANDATVYKLSGKTVTAVWTDGFWIEEANRSAGIKVLTAGSCTIGSAVAAGASVDVYGTFTTGDERLMNVTVIANNGAGTAIEPVIVTEKYTGGKGPNANTPAVTSGKGIYGVGLLVKIAGSLSETGGVWYLDDGSGLLDGTIKGMKVISLTTPTAGSRMVIGVIGIQAGKPVIYATNIQ